MDAAGSASATDTEGLEARLSALQSPDRRRGQLRAGPRSVALIAVLIGVKSAYRSGWVDGLQSALLILVGLGILGFFAFLAYFLWVESIRNGW